MKIEDQHIALLTALGVKRERSWPIDVGEPEGVIMYPCWVWPEGDKQREIPELTLDLIHEAETKLLTDSPDKHRYASLLGRHDYWSLIHATKEWKLECLIRTLNLWAEQKS